VNRVKFQETSLGLSSAHKRRLLSGLRRSSSADILQKSGGSSGADVRTFWCKNLGFFEQRDGG